MEPQVYEHPSGWKVSLNKCDDTGWYVEMWDGIDMYEGWHLTSEEGANEKFAWAKAELQRRIAAYGTWITPDEACRVILS